ncbi:MAG: Gfo/Idh/MocA family oxidoreductase [Chloroflexi bacterium]|nr:Gfo/Idh/MocA family oxidoreductase [Chloroflexota bacterium]
MLSAAIIGGGFMGITHAETLRRMNIPIKGMLGIDSIETDSFLRRCGISKGYSNLDELANDPTVDIVHICTPNNLHFAMAKTLLQSGKHVIVEKPLANTSQEAYELIQLAKQNNLVGAVNYSIRYYPLNQEAHSRIATGFLGEPRILHAEYCQDWLFLPTDWNWRLNSIEGGQLRVVGDIGTHVMDLLCWLTGLKILEVFADLATFLPVRKRPTKNQSTFSNKLVITTDTEDVAINTEDFASILLRFDNGARGVITLSQINAGRKNAFWWEINGSSSSMYWHQEEPNQLWLGYREKANEILLKDPALMLPESRRYCAYPGGHAEGYPDSFVQHFSEVYRYIENARGEGKPSFPTFETGYEELVLCESIQRSASENRWVKVIY